MRVHKHKWELKDKTILEAPLTKIAKANLKEMQVKSGMPREFYLDKLILTFTCECGKYRIEERPKD